MREAEIVDKKFIGPTNQRKKNERREIYNLLNLTMLY